LGETRCAKLSGSKTEVTASENARSATKELNNSYESKSTRLCQRHLKISEEKQNRRGYQGQTQKRRHLYVFIHSVLLIYCSYPQRTQRHVQPNIFYTHIFPQCTKQDCMHRSNTMMAMLKCPKRRDKCNQTHYSILNTHQELSYSSKFNISRFALHGAQQIVQLLVNLSIINTST
jgi:hypothetical protein